MSWLTIFYSRAINLYFTVSMGGLGSKQPVYSRHILMPVTWQNMYLKPHNYDLILFICNDTLWTMLVHVVDIGVIDWCLIKSIVFLGNGETNIDMFRVLEDQQMSHDTDKDEQSLELLDKLCVQSSISGLYRCYRWETVPVEFSNHRNGISRN